MILLEPYIKFLIEHDLTQDQFLLLELLYHNRIDLIRKYKKQFPTDDGTMISKYLISKLVDKEFLLVKNNQYALGNKFIEIYVTPEIATNEIFNLYPPFIIKDNGVQVPLTSMDRNIFKNIYIRKIKYNLKEHKEILKDLKYGVDKGLIKIGINKFLTSEQWKAFRNMRKKEKDTEDLLENDF